MENIKVSYRLKFVDGFGNSFNQRLKITNEQFKYFKKEILKRLEEGVPYGNYLQLPIKSPYNNDEFSMNLSTLKFIKDLLPKELQLKVKSNRNTYLKVIDVYS